MPKRALITGVSGQDGSYLSERLIAEGWAVHGTVRPDGARPSDAPSSLRVHALDLRAPAGFAEILEAARPDVIFNLGGISSVARSWQEPRETSEASGLAVVAILEGYRQWSESSGVPARFVQASSSEIFGSATESPQSESTTLNPGSPYGAAKAFAHMMVRVFRARGMFASNAILYNHESVRRPQAFVTRKITSGVADIAQGRSSTLQLGNLDAVRDWSSAEDVVEALMLIALADESDDFIVASGQSRSVRDFVAAAFSAVGIADWEPYVTVDASLIRPTDAPDMRGNPAHIRDTLGWTPRTTFNAMVAEMVNHDLALGAPGS
jgi:GDPmannose 4,6-dehydratase